MHIYISRTRRSLYTYIYYTFSFISLSNIRLAIEKQDNSVPCPDSVPCPLSYAARALLALCPVACALHHIICPTPERRSLWPTALAWQVSAPPRIGLNLGDRSRARGLRPGDQGIRARGHDHFSTSAHHSWSLTVWGARPCRRYTSLEAMQSESCRTGPCMPRDKEIHMSHPLGQSLSKPFASRWCSCRTARGFYPCRCFPRLPCALLAMLPAASSPVCTRA